MCTRGSFKTIGGRFYPQGDAPNHWTGNPTSRCYWHTLTAGLTLNETILNEEDGSIHQGEWRQLVPWGCLKAVLGQQGSPRCCRRQHPPFVRIRGLKAQLLENLGILMIDDIIVGRKKSKLANIGGEMEDAPIGRQRRQQQLLPDESYGEVPQCMAGQAKISTSPLHGPYRGAVPPTPANEPFRRTEEAIEWLGPAAGYMALLAEFPDRSMGERPVDLDLQMGST